MWHRIDLDRAVFLPSRVRIDLNREGHFHLAKDRIPIGRGGFTCLAYTSMGVDW